MKKVFFIVFWFILLVSSYFAYVVVEKNNTRSLEQQVKVLQSSLNDIQKSKSDDNTAVNVNLNKIHDILFVALPDNKKVIDSAFGRNTTTQPAK